ncbi:MAG: hypothetical protein M3506_05040 [Chloroflexota bacterium]|nr:hypothetical protein [Chloroflexota bacterium]
MFRIGLLLRALPSILAELVSLIWYAYRTGDRGVAAAALVWLTSTVALFSFSANALLTALNGGEVQLRAPALIAAVPLSMWLARELLGTLMRLVGWLLALLGADPVESQY